MSAEARPDQPGPDRNTRNALTDAVTTFMLGLIVGAATVVANSPARAAAHPPSIDRSSAGRSLSAAARSTSHADPARAKSSTIARPQAKISTRGAERAGASSLSGKNGKNGVNGKHAAVTPAPANRAVPKLAAATPPVAALVAVPSDPATKPPVATARQASRSMPRQPARGNDRDTLASRWIPDTSLTAVPGLGRSLNDAAPRGRASMSLAANERSGSADGTYRASGSAPGSSALQGYQQLQSMVRVATERSAAVRDAQAQVRANAQDVKQAAGARWPQVSVDVNSRYTQGAGDNQTSAARGSPFYSVSGSMPVYDWGRISQTVDSRSAGQRAAEARLDAALDTLAADTTVAALEVGRQRAAVVTADTYLRNVQRLVSMLTEITREDPGRIGELTQARSRVLQAQVNRDSLAGKLREAEIALERLIGRSDMPIDAIVAALDTVPPLQTLLEAIPEQPGLRALEADRQSQVSLAQSLASARLPQVSAVVSRAPVAPGVVNGYGSYAGLNVNIPLFRGGSDIAAQRAAEERAASAAEKHEQGTVDLRTRLRVLHESATAQLGRVPEYYGLLRESDQVRRGFFEQWYQMGRRSLFELLSAESEHYSLQSAHLSTLFDGLQSNARLRGEAGALAAWLGLRDTGPDDANRR
mgnify:CR=1 FL=1